MIQKVIDALNRTNAIVCNLAENSCGDNLENCQGELTACEEALLEAQTPTPFANNMGLILNPLSNYPDLSLSTTGGSLDAAGESVTIIGKIQLSSGSGTKTISAAGGGKMYINTGAVTFVNAGTNLRVGVQDVTLATGIEDGTFDVYGDLTGVTDTIASNDVIAITMDSGSKSISHGDVVAFSVEMTTRGGADSVIVSRKTTLGALSSTFPYMTIDTGSGPGKSGAVPPAVVIKFDDGSVGFFEDLFPYVSSPITYNNGSTPDEYGLLFTLPVKADLTAVISLISNTPVATPNPFDLVIYSDPLGTPIAERTITVLPALTSGITGTAPMIHLPIEPPFSLTAGVPYVIGVMPTSVNSITLNNLDFNFTEIKRATPLGDNWSLASRTDATGPFVPDTTQLPAIALYLNNITS